MRKILFRGKRVDNGEWVTGCYVKSKISGCYILISKLQCSKTAIKDDFDVYEVIPETVGQDTGLTDKNDKNGQKIFEGDILRVSQNEVVEIYYDECYCQFRARTANGVENAIDYYCGYPVQYEVIGNIHDNPELLKEE